MILGNFRVQRVFIFQSKLWYHQVGGGWDYRKLFFQKVLNPGNLFLENWFRGVKNAELANLSPLHHMYFTFFFFSISSFFPGLEFEGEIHKTADQNQM